MTNDTAGWLVIDRASEWHRITFRITHWLTRPRRITSPLPRSQADSLIAFRWLTNWGRSPEISYLRPVIVPERLHKLIFNLRLLHCWDIHYLAIFWHTIVQGEFRSGEPHDIRQSTCPPLEFGLNGSCPPSFKLEAHGRRYYLLHYQRRLSMNTVPPKSDTFVG